MTHPKEPTVAAPARRSLLFVPGGEPGKIAKARGSVADTLVLDLEDAVATERKAEARALVAAALRSPGTAAELAVRVNPPGSPACAEDVAAVVAAGGRVLLVPKAEDPAAIADFAARLGAVEAGAGAAPGAVRLLLLVESPRGVAAALALATSSPRVEALCFGHADFSLEMGLEEADASRGVVLHARCAIAVAARAAGVAPIDCVHLAVRDEAAFREDAVLGRSLGFDGKLCIHPRQAELANEAWTPSPERVARASRILEAAGRAAAEGRGVFAFEGRMVDAPVLAVERRVLERARRSGRGG